MAVIVDQKINDLPAVAGLIDTHQLEIDIGGTTPGKVTGLQLKDVLQTVPATDTIMFESNGSDVTGDGTPQNPYQTAQAAHNSLAAGSLKLIKSNGSGVLDQSLTITRENTFLLAEGIAFAPSSGDAVTINSGVAATIGVAVGALDPVSGSAMNIISAGKVSIDIPVISGNLITAVGTHSLSSGEFFGDLIVNGGFINVDALDYSGTIPFTTNVFGRLGREWYGTMLFFDRTRRRREHGFLIGASTVLNEGHAGASLFTQNTSAINITLPQESTLALPLWWNSEIIRTESGAVNFLTEGSDVIKGITSLDNPGERAIVTSLGTAGGITTWSIAR